MVDGVGGDFPRLLRVQIFLQIGGELPLFPLQIAEMVSELTGSGGTLSAQDFRPEQRFVQVDLNPQKQIEKLKGFSTACAAGQIQKLRLLPERSDFDELRRAQELRWFPADLGDAGQMEADHVERLDVELLQREEAAETDLPRLLRELLRFQLPPFFPVDEYREDDR